VDGDHPVVGEDEDDHLEQVPGRVGADHEHPRWIGIGVEIDRHQLVLDRVQDLVVADAVFAGRSMDLHRWTS
jgi:hypothetical protein